jgi:alpha-glucosidase
VPDAARQDPIFFRTAGERVGRDGCRVPLPWEGGPPGFGFTSGTPWLPIPEEWTELTVERQRGRVGSTLELYRRALAERPSGAFAWRESPSGTIVFERGSLVCAVNVDAERLELPAGELVVATELPVDGALARDAAAWIRVIPGG